MIFQLISNKKIVHSVGKYVKGSLRFTILSFGMIAKLWIIPKPTCRLQCCQFVTSRARLCVHLLRMIEMCSWSKTASILVEKCFRVVITQPVPALLIVMGIETIYLSSTKGLLTGVQAKRYDASLLLIGCYDRSNLGDNSWRCDSIGNMQLAKLDTTIR